MVKPRIISPIFPRCIQELIQNIALLPLDENGEENEEGEVFIYRYSEDSEGNPSLDNIEDDEEYEAVSDRFDELLDEAAFEEMDD